MTRQVTPRGDRAGKTARVENLECRVLLSAGVSPHSHATPTFRVLHAAAAAPFAGAAAGGITPGQMTQAYGVNQIRFGSVAGTGAGQTIAIIDAYDDPNAMTDLTAFDAYYGLSNPPSFLKLNQSGSAAALPSTDPGAKGNTWELEESLDIEWAHVIAPQANLILYEANSPNWSDLMAAVGSAVGNPAVSVVSMSFGSPEQAGQSYYDASFTSAHATFLASTGDTGGSGSYPSTSPNVVAVGGTGLSIDSSGNYLGESAWSGSNGGTSTQEAEPAWQQLVQSSGLRTTPDVAMDANPSSGVPVYDTFDGGASSPWFTVGGTSLATPMWAGLIATADQGRALIGQAPLTSLQTHQMLYSAPGADFHDVTTGANAGNWAGPGYDQVTGLGSPVANLLVPFLAGFSTAQSPAGTASFVSTDSSTQGTWGGTYGSDGYDVFNDSASLPAYAQLSASNTLSWTWAGPTSDPRAMQDAPAATGRTASCLYSSSSFSLDLNLTDGQTHAVSLYLCDFDAHSRVETVQVADASTGAVLDSRTVSGFTGGEYLNYTLSGHVRITFVNNNPGANAVASGILFGSNPSTAAFAGVNTTLGGQWTGAYGADGYWVAGGAAALPSYARMSFANQQYWLWATSNTDTRYLQAGPGNATRVAACNYSSTSFTLDLNLSGGQARRVSLYLLDWEPAGRSETIQVADANSGRVLDVRSASGFGGGQYLSWNLSGHVKITFTNTGPLNAVLGGVFFDPVPAQPATTSAAFLKADSTTIGNWTGAYGADGYSVFNGNASLPGYAQLGVAPGQTNWTWAASTSDVRALQAAPGSTSRIEACYYALNSFSLDLNLTDGNTHRVALYLADYDYMGRAEQVQISNATTGAVLDTQSVSNFQSGRYLVWNMAGHVKITITLTGGNNAVASGIFFG